MLRISISRSPLMAAVLTVMHAAAAACLLAYAPRLSWVLAGVGALVASLVFHLWRDALLLASHSLVEISVLEDGSCVLLDRGGVELQGRVMKSTFVSPLLIAINVRQESGGHRSLVLLPDSAPAEDRRRLRVWLRHAIRPDQTGSAGL